MRTFFLLLLLYLCQQTYSQEVNVASVKQLPSTDAGKAYYPKFSTTGEYLLLTSDNYSGLRKYDLKNGKVTVVTKAFNTEYNVQISADGNLINIQ